MKNLLKYLNIKEHEISKVLFISGLFFSIFFYISVLETVSQAVFNVRVGVRYLPYMYIVLAFVVIGTVGVMSELLARHDKRLIFRYVMVWVTVKQCFGIYVLSNADLHPLFSVVLFIKSQLFIGVLAYTIWILVQDVSNLDFGKRLFSLISSIGILGAIAGSAFVGNFTDRIGVTGVYAVTTIFPLCALFFANTLLKRYRIITLKATTSGSETVSLKHGFRYLKTNKFYLYLLLFAIMLFLSKYLVDYQFNYIARKTIVEEEKLSAFMGNYYQLRTVLTLTLKLFIFSRVIINFGVISTTFTLPLAALVAGAFALASTGLYVTTFAKILITVFVASQTDALFQILYQPMEKRYKDMVIGLLEAGMEIGGMVLGGVITALHSENIVGYHVLSFLTIGLGGAAVLFWNSNRKNFTTFLGKTLKFSPDVDIQSMMGRHPSPEFLAFIKQHLESKDETARFVILDMLHNLEFEGKLGLLAETYTTGSKSIRFYILDTLFQHTDDPDFDDTLHTIAALVREPEEQIRLLEKLFLHPEKLTPDVTYELSLTFDETIWAECSETPDLYRNMYHYVMDENKEEALTKVIHSLLARKTTEHLLLAITILKTFIHREPKTVEGLLQELETLYTSLKDKTLLAQLIEIFALYDHGRTFFTTHIYPSYDHEIIRAVVVHYPETQLTDLLQRSDLGVAVLQKIYHIALASQGKDGKEHSTFIQLNKEVIAHLKILHQMLLQMETQVKSEHDETKTQAVALLRQEIDTLTRSALLFSIPSMLHLHRVMETDFVAQALGDQEKIEALIEILQDVLPHHIARDYLDLLKPDRLTMAEQVAPQAFSLWQATWIDHIANYIGGNAMEEHLTQMIERMVVLKAVPMFSALTADELFQISMITRYDRIPAGQLVIREGDSGDELYIVIEGKVAIYRNYGTDAAQKLRELGQGAVLGELAIIANQKRSATVVTAEDTVCLVMDGQHFVQLLPTNSSIALKLIQALALRLMN
jgi:hypothetical protein